MKSVELLYPYVLTPTSSRDYFSWQKHEPIFLPHPKSFTDQQLQALRNPNARLDGHRNNPSWRQSHQPAKTFEKNTLSKQAHIRRQQESQPGQSEYVLEVPYDAGRHDVILGGHYFGVNPFISALNSTGADCSGLTDFFDLETQSFQIECTGPIDPYHVADELVYMYPEFIDKKQQFVDELSSLIAADRIKPTPTPTLEPTKTPIPTAIRTPTPPNLPPNVSDAQATEIYAAQLKFFDAQQTAAPTPTEIVTTADAKDNGSTWFHIGAGVLFIIVGFNALRIVGNLLSNATGRGKTK